MNEAVTEYLTAVLEKDYGKIEAFLKNGFDVGICSVNGNTALRNASQMGDVKMLEYLLSKGADVNQRINYLSPVDGRFEEEFTPIFYAGNAETVKFLVDSGADVNATCKEGYTTLVKCCKYCHEHIVPIINMLLDCGADVSVQTKVGENAKMVSAIDVARDSQAFYKKLYAKGKNEKLANFIRNSEAIIELLSK